MRLGRFFFIILIHYCTLVAAEETDQFTLPPYELLDLGPIASQRLYETLDEVRKITNAEIQRLLPKVQENKAAAKKLVSCFNGDYIANVLYNKGGPGYPRWLREHRLVSKMSDYQYKEIWPWKRVYWLVFSQSPNFLLGTTPTIRMFDHYMGTDKIGHFFHQGNTYYQIYKYLLAHKKTPQQAHDLLINYGKLLEWTYLGLLVDGVYSNGDLSANYAGWKFYMNLTQTIRIGDQRLPPILVLKNNVWEFSPQVHKETLFKPYLSDNLNEAWNPSCYAFMHWQIRSQIRKRCADWIARNKLSPKMVQAKLKETSTWHGEDYGHWRPENQALTLNVCFEKQS